MGYMTDFQIVVSSKFPDCDLEKIAETLHTICGYENYLDWSENSIHMNDVKWYENHKDMITLSKKFPTLLFVVTSYGEEKGDIWRKAYESGNMIYNEIAQIIFPTWDKLSPEEDFSDDPEIKKIQSAIDGLQKQLTEAVEAKKKFNSLNPEQRLAIILHGKMCRFNHTDDCDWQYHMKNDIPDWHAHSQKNYILKAQRLLAVCQDADQAIKMVEIL